MIVRLRLSTMLVALVLGALSAFAVACGEQREGLISASRAEALQDDLDAIDEQVAAGRCDAVDGRLASLRREVQDLPGSVDADLRRALRDGVTKLEAQAPTDCDLARTTTTETTETVPTTTEPTETTPTTPETTPTAPQTTTTPPQTTTTPPETTPVEPPVETVPPADTTPVDPGGEQAPEGVIE